MIRRAGVDEIGEVNRLLERDFPGLDFSEVLANPLNVCLIEGESGAIFAWRGPGIFEVHVFFSARGREAIAMSHRMLAWMRARGAVLFWSAVPVESRKVVMFTRMMGWKSDGVRLFPHGRCEVFVSEKLLCRQQ